MSIHTAALLRGSATQSVAADNALATATVSAIAEQSHLVLGVEAHYDGTVNAIKTVQVRHGATTWWTARWDFTNGPFFYSLPVALKSSQNEAVSVVLEASGTGGTSGYATIWTATN